MAWSAQQSEALAQIKKWVTGGRSTPQVFKLFGYAGTGKTTLAKEVEHMVGGSVLYATFTGKAALVLRSKGCRDASTLHSLIYKTHQDMMGKFTFHLNPDSALKFAKVLVVDEASMVGEELGADVLSFGVKVLILGDPFQLPPVKDAGFFTLGKPDYMLTEIHRQAADNPIIRMSMDIREGAGLSLGRFGESSVIRRDRLGQKTILEAGQVLCGLNKSRRTFNDRIRLLRGISGEHPMPGDKLVCLKNDREKSLLNGGLWTVKESEFDEGVVLMSVLPDTTDFFETDVEVPIEFFTGNEKNLPFYVRREYDEFDYGYCLTTHKSQGSQWDSVVVFDESAAFRDDSARWLYTAVTRAAQKVTVVQ